ncbi:hypothetical protein HOLleu_43108 [Holothuria leucospilota]|uniref:SAP domain-containing protein n=1 Tax=Holothuria leucospilota TaxID=206669 RepID=A0A9Q0YHD7_HOLLE|nr:hypothetical protein HOLleu_43108 [Holothuria leucospilota]
MAQEELSLDETEHWTVQALRDFLRVRGLKTTGRKKELQSLYSAINMEVSIQMNKVEEDELRCKLYSESLIVDGNRIPDPFTELKDGWLCEKESKQLWPPSSYLEIAEWLLVDATCPSQPSRPNVRAVPNVSSSGSIVHVYNYIFLSSIFIFHRLGTTCNHVAAVVFKVDHAFMTGGSSAVPCTSKQCTWNVYKGIPVSTLLEGKKIADLQWTRPILQHQTFSPGDLVDALFPSCQNLSLFKYLETRGAPHQYPPSVDFNVASEEIVTTTTTPPLSMTELAAACKTVEELRARLLHYSVEEVAAIEQVTRGQSDNKGWFTQRSSRITASNIRAVMTRNQTLRDNSSSLSKDPNPLLKRLMVYGAPNPNLPSLKYGRLTEPVARKYYCTLQKERGHQKLVVTECGLLVTADKVFLGASPDGLVQCVCCGKGILEIKCSRTTEEPGPQNCSFLIHSKSGLTQLKKYVYYPQVQAQLKATEREWCDFFVYTPHGFHLERIYFYVNLMEEAVAETEEFFLSIWCLNLYLMK